MSATSSTGGGRAGRRGRMRERRERPEPDRHAEREPARADDGVGEPQDGTAREHGSPQRNVKPSQKPSAATARVDAQAPAAAMARPPRVSQRPPTAKPTSGTATERS